MQMQIHSKTVPYAAHAQSWPKSLTQENALKLGKRHIPRRLVCVCPLRTRSWVFRVMCVYRHGSTGPNINTFFPTTLTYTQCSEIVSFRRRSHESHRAVNDSKARWVHGCSLLTRTVKWKQRRQGINIFKTNSNSQRLSIWIAKCLRFSVLCLLPRASWNPFAGCATYDELGCYNKQRGRLQ